MTNQNGDAQMAEPTAEEFRAVLLHRIGAHKISVIKLLRACASLGLKQAKDIADHPVPFVLVVCSQAEAERLVGFINDLGGQAEVTEYNETTNPVIPNDAAFTVPVDMPAAVGKSGCVVSTAVFVAMLSGFCYVVLLCLRTG